MEILSHYLGTKVDEVSTCNYKVKAELLSQSCSHNLQYNLSDAEEDWLQISFQF